MENNNKTEITYKDRLFLVTLLGIMLFLVNFLFLWVNNFSFFWLFEEKKHVLGGNTSTFVIIPKFLFLFSNATLMYLIIRNLLLFEKKK
ncbi:hypothetical protein CMT75_18610 [Elizabethkingia anophelis]|nr:hypothetical protein [Elizabethkingia anophelis]